MVPDVWYYGAMIRETKAFDCTCEKCGYSWFSATIPSRCSECKSRKWNEGAKVEKMIIARDPEPEKPRVTIKPAEERKTTSCPKCHALNGNHFRGCNG